MTNGMIWCDIEPLRLVKQVLVVSLSFIWQLKSWQIVYLVGVAFVKKCIMKIAYKGQGKA